MKKDEIETILMIKNKRKTGSGYCATKNHMRNLRGCPMAIKLLLWGGGRSHFVTKKPIQPWVLYGPYTYVSYSTLYICLLFNPGV